MINELRIGRLWKRKREKEKRERGRKKKRKKGGEERRFLCPWSSPGKNIGVGCHSLLQAIFPTQELNLGLPHYRQILYHLSHQGSLEIILIGVKAGLQDEHHVKEFKGEKD